MKSLKIALALAVAALAFAAVPALAHHNANAQYDNSKETSAVGTLMEVRDIAPHAQWKVTVTNPTTKAQTSWLFEAMGNNALRRLGIAVKTDFRPGQQYTFFYTPARDGSNMGFITGVTINGKKFQIVKF
jgi:hypothetical protein